MMGTLTFLTLLACIHIVVGTSCPEQNKPVEVIVDEIKSDDEAAIILLCDTVSLEKGNEIKNLRQAHNYSMFCWW